MMARAKPATVYEELFASVRVCAVKFAYRVEEGDGGRAIPTRSPRRDKERLKEHAPRNVHSR